MIIVGKILYIYDCKHARRSNARRVAFTKELYGFTYSWKTKTGLKEKRKLGLLDEYIGAEAIADSAILVSDEHRMIFDDLFRSYGDILTYKVFSVEEEL
jgi:hypothetical protein